MRQLGATVVAVLFEIQRILAYLYFKLLYGLRIRGARYIPSTGPAILAPNHQTKYDALPVGLRVPSPLFYTVERSYFKKPVVGWWLRTFYGLPLSSSVSHEGYRQCLQVIRSGARLIIFPEGHRSADGGLGSLQKGAARAALTAGVPIVPVTIVGAYEAWPRSRRFPRFFMPIIVKYHRPIPCEVAAKVDLRRRVEEVNAELEATLRRRLEAWRRLQVRRRLQLTERHL